MRKPHDYDAELTALTDKARLLKDRKIRQLGELVIVTGADALPVEQLAGALLAAVATKDAATREGWREAGAGCFQSARGAARGATRGRASGAPRANSKQPPDAQAGQA